MPFLSTRMELYRDIHEMLKPSFLKHSIKPLMPLDTRENKYRTKKVTLFWVKKIVENKP